MPNGDEECILFHTDFARYVVRRADYRAFLIANRIHPTMASEMADAIPAAASWSAPHAVSLDFLVSHFAIDGSTLAAPDYDAELQLARQPAPEIIEIPQRRAGDREGWPIHSTPPGSAGNLPAAPRWSCAGPPPPGPAHDTFVDAEPMPLWERAFGFVFWLSFITWMKLGFIAVCAASVMAIWWGLMWAISIYMPEVVTPWQ